MVALPFTLTDGAGFAWDVKPDGQIGNGTSDAFDGGMENVDQRSVFTADTEMDGRQVVLRPGTSTTNPNVTLERRIYVPEDAGWARFIDTMTNTSTESVTYLFRMATNFGSDTLSRVVSSSDGDAMLSEADLSFVNDDASATGVDPQVGIAFGDGSLAPVLAAYTSVDRAELHFELTLAPGQSLSVMSFAAQSQDPAALQGIMGELRATASVEMSAGIPESLADTIANYAVTGFSEQTEYIGTADPDTLLGSDRDETFIAHGDNDLISAGAGEDWVDAGSGDDVVQGEAGDDILFGGPGADVLDGGADDDILDGDFGVLQSASTPVVLPDGGAPLALTVRAPTATQEDSVTLTGLVSRAPADTVNLVWLVDVSGSMAAPFTGAAGVGDRNGDGIDDQAIDMAIAGLEGLTDRLIETGHARTNGQVIAFNDTAGVVASGAIGGAVGPSLSNFTPGGGTNYETALQAAIAAFEDMGAGQNRLVMMSDGVPSGGVYLDEAAILRDPAGLNVEISTIALGSQASLYDLDRIDDGLLNSSVAQVSDAAGLTSVLEASPVALSELAGVEVEVDVNGVLPTTFAALELEETPLGVRFSLEVPGLAADAADDLRVRVVASDAAATSAEIVVTVADGQDPAGDDRLVGGSGADLLTGGARNDTLVGDDGRDTLMGEAGDDLLDGGAGDDWLLGGNGDDELHGGAGADRLLGGPGDNTVSYTGSLGAVELDLASQTASGGDADGDTLSGFLHGEGSQQGDTLSGDARNNTLQGLGGDDTLRGGAGDDILRGGDGFDFADFSGISDGIYVSLGLAGAPQDTWSAGMDLLEGIEGLIGTDHDDYLLGTAEDNTLLGGAGNDVLKSKGGNDRMEGGEGDDKLTGDAGQEFQMGGAGVDFIFGNAGEDEQYGGPGDDFLYGGRDTDISYGEAGDDTMRGNLGTDTLYGGEGADDLRGGGSSDVLYGGVGRDFMLGENGNDVLEGGSDNDVLLGGGGADRFVFLTGTGFDTVRDFETGTDTLDLQAFDLTDFAEVQGLAANRPTGLRIVLGGGDVAFLEGLTLADLGAADVLL